MRRAGTANAQPAIRPRSSILFAQCIFLPPHKVSPAIDDDVWPVIIAALAP